MKKVTDKATEARILDYIRPHLGECIYLYIDVSVYGIDSPFLDLWYDEDEDGICFVVMRYHDSLQIYSHKDDWDKGALMDIVHEYDIQAVNAKGSMLDALDEELGDSYEKRTGWILKGKSMADLKVDGLMEVEVAGVEDTEEIAELMQSHEHWKKMYPNKEKLAGQLAERIESGMGRSLVIRDKGRIIAHDATFAETDDIAMGSGLIVLDEYVDRMCNVALAVAMDKMMREEGKEKYFHLSDPHRMKAFKKIGNTVVAETGKWMKKNG